MRAVLSAILLSLLAGPLAAQTARNDGRFAVALHGAPDTGSAVVGRIVPGETVSLRGCEVGASWCVAGRGGGRGWVALSGLTLRGFTTQTPTPSPTPPAPQAQPEPNAPAARAETRPGPPLLLSTDVPHRNLSDRDLALRAAPDNDAAVVGTLAPGDGGRIDICDAGQVWCRMTAVDGSRGWVQMRSIGLRRLSAAR